MRRLITFDWAIKRLLRSKANFDVLEGFLSELLKDDIQIIEVLESESNQNRAADKFNRVDLKVRDRRQQIMLIEIQYDREYDYLQRMFYGVAKTVVEHLAEGQPYADIVKVISVNILYFDLGQGEDYVYHGQTVFTGIHKRDQLQLNEKQQELFQQTTVSALYPEYYLIKINQFDDVAKDPLDEWIYFLKHEEIKEHFTARGLQAAREKLDILKLPPEERAAYERYAEDLHYQASMFLSSYGDGFHEGRKEGLQEGLQQGLDQGRQEATLALARSLIGVLSVEVIAEKTGLSREVIESLYKN
ncbi:MAG: Rpn family recombination-promoting nuclease/putative transposase [Candidatus Competibacteraceae bacterium]|nr:MAG: Rpn family recombination-promoting nuclease/putative transposase [Candidatus Competibacteraceae bacterium]